MNECWDCVHYERTQHSPPDCIHPDRPEDEPWPEDRCKWKLSVADAKYQNEEGL